MLYYAGVQRCRRIGLHLFFNRSQTMSELEQQACDAVGGTRCDICEKENHPLPTLVPESVIEDCKIILHQAKVKAKLERIRISVLISILRKNKDAPKQLKHIRASTETLVVFTNAQKVLHWLRGLIAYGALECSVTGCEKDTHDPTISTNPETFPTFEAIPNHLRYLYH